MFSICNNGHRHLLVLCVLSVSMLCMIPERGSCNGTSPLEIRLDATDWYPTIGDSLTITCRVAAPDSVHHGEPYLPSGAQNPGIEPVWTRSYSGEKKVTVFGFRTYAVRPDTLSVGPFALDYAPVNGDSAVAYSPILQIPVQGILAASEDGSPPRPRPLRSLRTLGSSGLPWWIYGLIVIAAAVIVALVLYVRHRLRAVPTEERPLNELELLQQIRDMHLLERGEIKKYYVLISVALRNFIHRNMAYDARYRTSGEIIAALQATYPVHERVADIRRLLYEADLVKFAQYLPPPDESKKYLDRTEELVRRVLQFNAEQRAREEAEQEMEMAENPLQASHEPGGEG